ncbi:putative malonic semialdehyde reductase RutE [Iodidimonas gelatinilytica]|uniref:Putative NADH dehydrogenase/NAD(P)H nitroreductase JCM17844_10780 n=1 Tax=Iodidimonas gelatinilytica TaxID=1236966 RepID=A0A5A7MND5_9PROT|nr:malonic semialdehyde reductase [Iodidimonas gelatinilytica]GEQ97441.1 putative malonic semialdehyde reductase RutE [Iodidimonas gelatinilytica]GER02116.1 putative malonic semialdehyde reductase RutE [Iodidimonas gelatinilytica]
MSSPLNPTALDTLFRKARSYNRWQDKPVSGETLQALYDLLKWGPTSANCSPARFVFLQSEAAKTRLKPLVMGSNAIKVMTAPVVAIVAWDAEFYDKIPQLFPHNPEARDWFAHDADVAHQTAFRNSTLQGAYLMLAARALGLDCGPMSGFDNKAVDAEFFPDSQIKSNFLCAIGYGSTDELFPRSPRLAFDDACQVL